MRIWKSIAVMALMAMPAVLEAQTTDADKSGWIAYRNQSGEYEVRYPHTLSLTIPSGKTCRDGECKAIEQVILMGSDSTGGKPAITSMSFTIQRGVNPQHLPIQQWYEALAHRHLQPNSESAITVDGNPAIRRGPLVVQGIAPESTLYLPLNDSDVLTVAVPPGSALSETWGKIISTLTFTK